MFRDEPAFLEGGLLTVITGGTGIFDGSTLGFEDTELETGSELEDAEEDELDAESEEDDGVGTLIVLGSGLEDGTGSELEEVN